MSNSKENSVRITTDATEMSWHELVGIVASGCLLDFCNLWGNPEMGNEFPKASKGFKEEMHLFKVEDLTKILAYKEAWMKAEIPDVENVSYDIFTMLSKIYFMELEAGLWMYELHSIYYFLSNYGVQELNKLKKQDSLQCSEPLV